MQVLSNDFMAALAAEVTTLAMCWKITRRDGEVMGFTDHDRDIIFSGVTYVAAAGMGSTAVTSSLGLKVDNLELEGLLSDNSIAEADILAGKYDYAQIDVWLVNYADVAGGAMHVKTGWFGEIILRAGQFIAEVRGLSNALQTTIGDVYTPTCRARFGDVRCGYNLASVTHTGTVTTADGRLGFTDSARTQVDGYFDYGIVTMLSGANNGAVREIKRFEEKRFILAEPFTNVLGIGDSYQAIAGCDKRFDTCSARFNNAVNFRGEPHVPGTDRILKTASTR